MSTITFSTPENYDAFINMLEGMWDSYRDDNQEPEFSIADRLFDELHAAFTAAKPHVWPLSLTVSTVTVELASSVLENCLDYSRDYNPDEDDDPVIREDEVSIQ